MAVAVAARGLDMRVSIVLLLLASLQGFVAAQRQCRGEFDAPGARPPFPLLRNLGHSFIEILKVKCNQTFNCRKWFTSAL